MHVGYILTERPAVAAQRRTPGDGPPLAGSTCQYCAPAVEKQTCKLPRLLFQSLRYSPLYQVCVPPCYCTNPPDSIFTPAGMTFNASNSRKHFALKRHLLRASLHRKQLGERFAAWHRFTELTQNPSGF